MAIHAGHLLHSPNFFISRMESPHGLTPGGFISKRKSRASGPLHVHSSSSNHRTLCASSITSSTGNSSEFVEASRKLNLIPLYRCIFSDRLTPVLAYRCLVKEDDREAPSFLFESVEPGLQGRYSAVGAQPTMEIIAKENFVTVMDHDLGKRTEEFVDDPMKVPQRIMEKWNHQMPDELPQTFCGGWVGYFSYDTMRYAEKKKLPFSSAPKDDRNLPDIHLGLYDNVIVFDHVEKKAFVIHWVHVERYPSPPEAYEDGVRRLDELVLRVHDTISPRLPPGSIRLNSQISENPPPPLLKSNMTGEAYRKAVMESKERILAGDISRIELSQRFERRTFADPFEVYRALRITIPSPYMAYLQARGCILVASSPEMLARVKKVSSWDALRAAGKVSSWDALHAAGKVMGEPKVVAMELIDRLEVGRRGPYAGGFGSVSFAGDMEIALALRTIVFPTRHDMMYSYSSRCRREWVAHIQAGTGIVAGSDPTVEHLQCINKASALSRAIDLAEFAFVKS